MKENFHCIKSEKYKKYSLMFRKIVLIVCRNGKNVVSLRQKC